MSNTNLKKFLHVIYFFEDARTKSFKISMRGVKLLILLTLMLSIWTGSSIYMISSLTATQVDLRQRLAEAKDQVFDYQAKYSNVFERAYPQNLPAHQDLPLADKGAAEPEDDGPAVDADMALAAKKLKAVSSKNEKQVPAQLAGEPPMQATEGRTAGAAAVVSKRAEAENSGQAVEKTAAQAAPVVAAGEKTLVAGSSEVAGQIAAAAADPAAGNTPVVDIDSPQFASSPSGLEFKFRIKNVSKSEKASGYIWAVARLKAAGSPDPVLIGAPAGVLLADGNPNLIKSSAAIFGIWRYKAKSFFFNLPEELDDAEFESIDIKILDSQGQVSVHRVTVPIDFRPAVQPGRVSIAPDASNGISR